MKTSVFNFRLFAFKSSCLGLALGLLISGAVFAVPPESSPENPPPVADSCQKTLPAVRNKRQFSVRSGLLAMTLVGLVLHNAKMQREISDLRKAERAQRSALAVASHEEPERGRFQTLFEPQSTKNYGPGRLVEETNRIKTELGGLAPAEREAQIGRIRNELEAFADEDDTLKVMGALLPLASENQRMHILLENAMNPARSEQWVPLLADEIKTRRDRTVSGKKNTLDLRLASDAMAKFNAASRSATGDEKVLRVSRTIALAEALGGAFDEFKPADIDDTFRQWKSSPDGTERAALLTLMASLKNPKAEQVFRHMLIEELGLSDKDPKRQPHYALRLLDAKLKQGYQPSKEEKLAVDQASHDSVPGVKAVAWEIIARTDPAKATENAYRQLEEMDPGAMTQTNGDFLALVAKLSDYLKTVPPDIDYARILKIKSRMPKAAENVSLYTPSGQNRQPVAELAGALALNPAIETLRRGSEKDSLIAIQEMFDRMENISAFQSSYGLPNSDAQTKALLSALEKSSPAVRQKFIEIAAKTSFRPFVDTLLLTLAETEIAKPANVKDRKAAEIIAGLGEHNFYQNSSQPDKVPEALYQLGKKASADSDPLVRAAAISLLGNSGTPAATTMLMDRARTINPAENQEELDRLLVALLKVVKSNPDQVNKVLLRALMEKVPADYQPKQIPQSSRAYYVKEAIQDLRARVGL